MPDTPASLLDRLCASTDPTLWEQLVSLYTPHIRGWLGQLQIAKNDVDDLLQEIFVVVIRELPRFHRAERRGAFRRWLRTIAEHRVQAYWRSRKTRPAAVGNAEMPDVLQQLQDPADALSRLWDEQHDRHVLRGLLQLVKTDFEERSWEVFERLVFREEKAAIVAVDLDMSVPAVYATKSRVLKRLRQEARGLVD